MPYIVFTENERAIIASGIAAIQDKTCIRFFPRSRETDMSMSDSLTVYFSIYGAKHRKKIVNSYEIVNSSAVNSLL